MSTKNRIKLLLTENIDNLGIVGDIVEVRGGFARNYLLPQGRATEPTKGNVARVAERRAQVEAELQARRAQQEKMIGELATLEVTLQRSHNEEGLLYGSVNQHDIALAMSELGYKVAEREIRIGTPIKRLDSYKIPIQLASDLKAEIKLWVVSDKPADQLGAAKKQEQPAEPAKA